MGDLRQTRLRFLLGVSWVYLFAFLSLYTQIPGLYGREGIFPAWKMLRFSGKSLLELMKDSPTLLWLGPSVGLDTELGMELICLLGALLSLGAVLFQRLRDSLVFLLLWVLYLSLYQVGQVFLYFQWDSLLLEVGFLAILVAPLYALRGKDSEWSTHDGITFWLIRWLLFRLMFASGVVKLTSRCPTWWGLTALTYHYETQCIPTPAAWFAHQLPVWFQKLSVVATYFIEIGVPWLFFLPFRRLRIFSFYCQVLLQILIILTGNYNFFNLLTIVVCLPLLDDQHFTRAQQSKKSAQKSRSFLSYVSTLLELVFFGFLIFLTVKYFDLQINWEKHSVESKTGFTYHDFQKWLRTLLFPSIWIAAASLGWEILTGMCRSASTHGFFWKLWLLIQWAIFSCAAVAMFTVSLVPYTYVEFETNGQLWPSVRQMFKTVDRYQLTNSYGLFRRMTGVGGRPEVVLEGSYDGKTWTEIEFMYKPGNISAMPPVVSPHQPRLDWQMWFAALGHHTDSPWFTSFVYRLLQGNKDVIRLVQNDESLYPFQAYPPTYIRAQLYKYWFTEVEETGPLDKNWWRRRHVEEFYPAVSLGDPTLESFLNEQRLKDKPPVRSLDAPLPYSLKVIREFFHPIPAPLLIYSLILSVFTIYCFRCLLSGKRKSGNPKHHSHSKPHLEKKKQKVSSGSGESAKTSAGGEATRRNKKIDKS